MTRVLLLLSLSVICAPVAEACKMPSRHVSVAVALDQIDAPPVVQPVPAEVTVVAATGEAPAEPVAAPAAPAEPVVAPVAAAAPPTAVVAGAVAPTADPVAPRPARRATRVEQVRAALAAALAPADPTAAADTGDTAEPVVEE